MPARTAVELLGDGGACHRVLRLLLPAMRAYADGGNVELLRQALARALLELYGGDNCMDVLGLDDETVDTDLFFRAAADVAMCAVQVLMLPWIRPFQLPMLIACGGARRATDVFLGAEGGKRIPMGPYTGEIGWIRDGGWLTLHLLGTTVKAKHHALGDPVDRRPCERRARVEAALVNAMSKRTKVHAEAARDPPTPSMTFAPPCDGAVAVEFAAIMELDLQRQLKAGRKVGLFGKTESMRQDFWGDLVAGVDLAPDNVSKLMDGRFYRLMAVLVPSLRFGIVLHTLGGVRAPTFTLPIPRILRAMVETMHANFVLPSVIATGAPRPCPATMYFAATTGGGGASYYAEVRPSQAWPRTTSTTRGRPSNPTRSGPPTRSWP